jgi:hypothetical protein
VTTTSDPVVFFVERYRWSGTTPEAFLHHQITAHADLVRALPGLCWYETFYPTEPDRDWPIQHGRGLPDCYDIIAFESEEAVAGLAGSAERQAVAADNRGFCANLDARRVRRYTWVPEPEAPAPYAGERDDGRGGFPTLVFESYRWAGTSPEECLQHYLDVHLPLGLKLPGIRWYEAFLDADPTRDWPVQGRRVPDFNVILQFESMEVVESLRGTQEWAEAKLDDLDFVGNTFGRTSVRYTWLPDPWRPPAWSLEPLLAGGAS